MVATGSDPIPTGAGGDPIHKSSEENNNSINAKKTSQQEFKICKGCAFYSSKLKSNGKNPLCLGTQIPLPKVSSSMPGRYKVAAGREGKLSYFKYVCVGYSIFLHNEDSSTNDQYNPTHLPICSGYELLMGKKSTAKESTGRRQIQVKDDLYFIRSRMVRDTSRPDFATRFTKSAEVVASGVVKNLLRVGSYIKDSMLHTDRKGPK